MTSKRELYSLIQSIREFFNEQSFDDVLTPPIVENPGMETHIHPFQLRSIHKNKNLNRIIGKKYLEDLKINKSGAILFSAHIGNWEICPLIITRRGEEVTSIYRHANNPITEKIIQRLRKGICLYAPKGPKGANTLFKVLRQKKYAAILADQKLNEGESIKFLGHPAKTATAIAELSIRLSVPIIPVHVERIKGVKFKYIVEKPIKVDNEKMNHDDKVKMILLKINNKIEKWILKNPEQWLWIHNRWEK